MSFGALLTSVSVAGSIPDAHHWTNRLIIVADRNDEGNLIARVRQFVSNNQCAFDDRRLLLIAFGRNAEAYLAAPDFVRQKDGIWLVGYDGGVKAHAKTADALAEMFELIDQMPMRQAEKPFEACLAHSVPQNMETSQ
jgi:hypothetical protein